MQWLLGGPTHTDELVGSHGLHPAWMRNSHISTLSDCTAYCSDQYAVTCLSDGLTCKAVKPLFHFWSSGDAIPDCNSCLRPVRFPVAAQWKILAPGLTCLGKDSEYRGLISRVVSMWKAIARWNSDQLGGRQVIDVDKVLAKHCVRHLEISHVVDRRRV